MQHLFEVVEDKQHEVDRVLEIYLKNRVSDMMYQAHVDSIKVYNAKRDQILDDTLARPIEHEYEQYFGWPAKWCNDEVWPELCCFWCSEEFKINRKRGQACRLSGEDTTQNHGGSRPFTETQHVLVSSVISFAATIEYARSLLFIHFAGS